MIPKLCATYDGLNVVSDDILADHFDIARFSNRHDPGYFQLVGHLSRISRKSQSIGTTLCLTNMLFVLSSKQITRPESFATKVCC